MYLFVVGIGGWVICFLLPCGFDRFTRGPLGIIWACLWDCLMFVSIVLKLGSNMLLVSVVKTQKVNLKILPGDVYTFYDLACADFNLDTLSLWHTKLCTKLCCKSAQEWPFFIPYSVNTRSFKTKLLSENYCSTTRCYNAPYQNRLEKCKQQNFLLSVGGSWSQTFNF